MQGIHSRPLEDPHHLPVQKEKTKPRAEEETSLRPATGKCALQEESKEDTTAGACMHLDIMVPWIS